jgi:hypothetical protein
MSNEEWILMKAQSSRNNQRRQGQVVRIVNP